MSVQGAPPSPQKLKRNFGVAALLAALVAVSGVVIRHNHEAKLDQWTQSQSIQTVELISPIPGSGEQELILPGDIEAYYEAPLHSQVSGYVNMWYYDIGAKVRAGEVLAKIDTPELDQQLEQAKGELAKAEANAKLSKLTSKRWEALRASVAVSPQSADEKAGDVNVRTADVTAARANVERLNAMKGFAQIVAPFAGVVTARKVDVGALVGTGNGQYLFKVADIHQMRVYVQAPQAYASRLRQGMIATLKLPQYPNRSFQAKLSTTSNAISQQSRTLLVQLLADNGDGALWPGSYTEVHFKLPDNPAVLRVPASALLFRGEHLKVATLGPDNKVVLKPIEVVRDLGVAVEVSSGIDLSERIIDNPSDSIAEGDVVRVAGEKEDEHPKTTAGQKSPERPK